MFHPRRRIAIPDPVVAVLIVLAAAVPLRAQEHDELPTEHVAIIPPGGHVDLYSGLILPGREYRAFKADLRFDRDGAGFYLEPLLGGQPAHRDDATPGVEWTTNRLRIAYQGGFVFASESSVANGKECDLALVSSAGGGQSVRFNATGGVAAGGGFRFGEVPAAGRLEFQSDFDSDAGTADSDRFYVRTADGGIASVRIVE